LTAVGCPLRKIPFDNYAELVSAFITIVLMVFTFNIGIGMIAGLFLSRFSNYFQTGQRGARGGVGARWSLTVLVSESVLERVRQYIWNQEKHHRKKAFAEE